jgi:hypothetical protein
MSDRRTRADQEPSKSSDLWADAEVIFHYTRVEALDDGVLAAVPAALATEAGFRRPVASPPPPGPTPWPGTRTQRPQAQPHRAGRDRAAVGRAHHDPARHPHSGPRLWCRCSGCHLPAGPCVPSRLPCTSLPGRVMTGSRC